MTRHRFYGHHHLLTGARGLGVHGVHVRRCRRLIGALIVLPLALIGTGVGAVQATVPQTGSGAITATLVASSAQPAGDSANVLFTQTYQSTFSGALSGPFTENASGVFSSSAGTSTFHGTDTCTCTVVDASGVAQTGTLTLHFEGTTAADGTLSGQFVIVGGTGGLATLHGQGTFQGSGTAATYTSNLHFDPSS